MSPKSISEEDSFGRAAGLLVPRSAELGRLAYAFMLGTVVLLPWAGNTAQQRSIYRVAQLRFYDLLCIKAPPHGLPYTETALGGRVSG